MNNIIEKSKGSNTFLTILLGPVHFEPKCNFSLFFSISDVDYRLEMTRALEYARK